MFIYRCHVQASWLDLNVHMSARAYLDVFTDAGVLALRDLGLGPSYLEGGHSVFTGDFHITYVREIRAGGTLTVATRILDLDTKRFVFHQEMTDDCNGALAATAEHLQLNVGLASRKVEPFRPEIFDRLRKAQQDQGSSPPRNVGRAASLMAAAPAR
ncbi:thioesterase family protein [Bradyrhizobium huanghuaihaiense]|uniref:thioesterase family protein n=1 Tax=Bradyrhizobium huanghuaihaiense TaxID=990078 RepID=UPI0021AAE73D|nr:thioesterase family protein [Bradyrhizobium sp. CB3035]UWU75850.1 thioesterase family protein [Bradyrhizobium sp. CB3035]